MNYRPTLRQAPGKELLQKLKAHKTANPRAYLRTIASDMGTNEAQLMAVQSGNEIIQLENSFTDLIHILETAGRLTAICRNDGAVSEISGSIEIIDMGKEIATLSIEKSEIIIDRQMLGYVFFAQQGERSSLQFYDLFGDSAIKFFFKQEVPDFSKFYQPGPTFIRALKKTYLNRFQKNNEKQLASNLVCRRIIEHCADKQVNLNIIVENFAVRQQFSGYITKVVDARGWFNILDSEFNLHLKEELINESTLITNENDYVLEANSKVEQLVTLSVPKNYFKEEAFHYEQTN